MRHLQGFPDDRAFNTASRNRTDELTFIINQWDLHPIAVIAAFKRMRARRKKPESTPEEFADALENVGLVSTAERLREAAELI